jgi:uncharacterized protein YraI
MLNRKLLPAMAGAALLLVAGTAAASAATAFAASSVNVRSGPGTNYSVVDTLRRGERVDVEFCRGVWCSVSKAGPDGWVNARYLTQDYRRDRDRWDDDDDFYLFDRPARPIRPHFRPFYRSQVCLGGPNASFCIWD